MEKSFKENFTSAETWKRGLFMLLFAFVYSVAEVVLTAVVLFQFGSRLITGKSNQRLLNLGQSLATYIYQIVLLLTYKTEDRPFPFMAWPKGAPTAGKARSKKKAAPAVEKNPAPEEKPAGETEQSGTES